MEEEPEKPAVTAAQAGDGEATDAASHDPVHIVPGPGKHVSPDAPEPPSSDPPPLAPEASIDPLAPTPAVEAEIASRADTTNRVEPDRAAKSAKSKPASGDSWIETVKTVVYALLIALVIRTLLFQPFNIPSSSMESTLLVGDYLFVEKFAYGYSRYSFPFGLAPISGRVFGSDPARGDVVVFKFPPDNSTDYIKRVIGLPGDRIQMLNGRLYINDKAVPKVRVADYVQMVDGIPYRVPRYQETLPNGKKYFVLDSIPNGQADNTEVFVVPPGHYFMMGDNRDNSNDSREGVGYVPAANLVGKAELIFFSTDGNAHFWEFWRWPWTVRYNRLFTVID
jgi:signal peptidase I